MENIFEKKIAQFVGGGLLLIVVFFLGAYAGGAGVVKTVIPSTEQSLISEAEFAPFWKAWMVLNEKYAGASSSTPQEKVWGAIEGLAASEGDPYTVFFPPEESKMFNESIAGNFEGIGMEIGLKDKLITVVAPVKNSPAARADVRTGDKLIKINGESALDMSVDAAVKMIRGKKGTEVKLTFLREGHVGEIEKTIIRDTIEIPTLETEIKDGSATSSSSSSGVGLRKDGVFVIRLFSFTAESPNLFRNALREFVRSGSDKLLLDLRGNPGGYLEAAWDIASWFLPSGKVIVKEDFGSKAEPQIFRSKGYDIFSDNLKMVILVDGGSASASEILAGALREHGVAKLVGTKTFGKGSVQELVKITPDTSLKVTIARWLTPNGTNLSAGGLIPDYTVELTAKDIEAKNDLQLKKAIELLTTGF